MVNKEKEIQRAKLEKEALVRKILVAGITGILLLGIFIFRNITLKRKNEKQRLEHELELQQIENAKAKAEFQQQATELEMQALRAQMNPHFIFNSLNSINRFILQNNRAQASEYLTKFSRLIRLILQNSQEPLITLESELESLRLYLELEAVRFDHHFEFTISVEKDLDVSAINVPPLIIQPYTENAIWHGLMHKEEKGHLGIEIFQQGDMLCCKITDDGIGRKKAAELKSKSASHHKSMGMQITASRIEMLQQKKQLDSYIKITDLVLTDGSACGTEVIIKIPLME
ncbi:MAG: sensor histidine kinase [Chitinophagaceae bacterium]